MRGNLKQALDNADMTYEQLSNIANDIIKPYIEEIDNEIKYTRDHIENLTNDIIRELMVKLSLKSYLFSDVKEKSALKAECAEALRKEAYAKEFALSDGSVAAKDNTAILNISDEILAESVYNLISALFKTKLDEIHRVIDVLKTVLMSRMQEAKLSMNNIE